MHVSRHSITVCLPTNCIGLINEQGSPPQEVAEWCDRCQSFHVLCQMVKDMYNRLTAVPNRSLLYDIYQYMWDAKETTILLDSYITWLGM